MRFDLTHAGQVGTDDPKDADDITHLVLRKCRYSCETIIISVRGQCDLIVALGAVAQYNRRAVTGHDRYSRFEIGNNNNQNQQTKTLFVESHQHVY